MHALALPSRLNLARHRINRRLGHWVDHLAPRCCALCQCTLAPGTFPGVCTGCLLDLPGARQHRCRRCGLPAPDAARAQACACTPQFWSVDDTLVVADYAPPLDRAITALKFGRQLALARPLGELITTAWLGRSPGPPLDCLIPVPLGPDRLASRGFNQALEMARAMAASLPRPQRVLARGLLRLRNTPAQSGLDLAERRANLTDCFHCPTRLDGLSIGLVDDVMTSGSTIAEAAGALKAAGAARVVALVVARTPLPASPAAQR